MAKTLNQLLVALLNIPVDEWPPNAYCWLRLSNFENDPKIIDEAAKALITKLQALKKLEQNQTKRHQEVISYLINQTIQRYLLLQSKHPLITKAVYDARLRGEKAIFSSKAKRFRGLNPKRPPVPPQPPPISAAPVQVVKPKPPIKTRASNPKTDFPAISTTSRESKIRRKRPQPQHTAYNLGRSTWLAHFLGAMLGCMVGVILAYLLAAVLKSFQ